MLLSMGRNVFIMDDYQNLIYGGHNFSVVSSSVDEISSQYTRCDLAVLFDQRSVDTHKKDLSGSVIVYNSDAAQSEGIGIPMSSEASRYARPELMFGVAGVAVFAAYAGLGKAELESTIKKEYKRNVEGNLSYADVIYGIAEKAFSRKRELKKQRA